jgi:hypothetical protein
MMLANHALGEIRMLDERAKRHRARIVEAVTASGTALTDVFGAGRIIARAHLPVARGRRPSP